MYESSKKKKKKEKKAIAWTAASYEYLDASKTDLIYSTNIEARSYNLYHHQ